MIHVLIADDHAVVRAGLRQIITQNNDMKVAAEAKDGIEVLKILKSEKVDVVVLDISMPGLSGAEVLKTIRREYPKIPVLMLSMYPEEQYALRVLKSGASGYLTKESAPELLISAIRKVVTGGKFISASVAEKLADEVVNGKSGKLHELLSDREFEILKLIGSGKTVSEIADKIFISVKTVSTYRTRILEKMKMKNNAELMQYVMNENLMR